MNLMIHQTYIRLHIIKCYMFLLTRLYYLYVETTAHQHNKHGVEKGKSKPCPWKLINNIFSSSHAHYI